MHRGCFGLTPKPPLAGRRTPRPGPVRVCVCSSFLAGSGGLSSRAHFGALHLSFGPFVLLLCSVPSGHGLPRLVCVFAFFPLFFLFFLASAGFKPLRSWSLALFVSSPPLPAPPFFLAFFLCLVFVFCRPPFPLPAPPLFFFFFAPCFACCLFPPALLFLLPGPFPCLLFSLPPPLPFLYFFCASCFGWCLFPPAFLFRCPPPLFFCVPVLVSPCGTFSLPRCPQLVFRCSLPPPPPPLFFSVLPASVGVCSLPPSFSPPLPLFFSFFLRPPPSRPLFFVFGVFCLGWRLFPAPSFLPPPPLFGLFLPPGVCFGSPLLSSTLPHLPLPFLFLPLSYAPPVPPFFCRHPPPSPLFFLFLVFPALVVVSFFVPPSFSAHPPSSFVSWCLFPLALFVLPCCRPLCCVSCCGVPPRLVVCCHGFLCVLLVAAVCCAASPVVSSRCFARVAVCCHVLVCIAVCCAVFLGVVLRRAAARCSALRCVVVRCVVLSRSFRCCRTLCRALGHCSLPWGPVFSCLPAPCPLCCVCFGVACCCVLLFAAVLCAVCVLGCRVLCFLFSPPCALLGCAVLVPLCCAVCLVCAVSGAWCCRALTFVVRFPGVPCCVAVRCAASSCGSLCCAAVSSTGGWLP